MHWPTERGEGLHSPGGVPNEHLIEYYIQLQLKGAQEMQTTRIKIVRRWAN